MQITYRLNFKTITIVFNVLLIFLCIGYFIGHGFPQSLMLWASAVLWFVVPIVNLFYIFTNKKD